MTKQKPDQAVAMLLSYSLKIASWYLAVLKEACVLVGFSAGFWEMNKHVGLILKKCLQNFFHPAFHSL